MSDPTNQIDDEDDKSGGEMHDVDTDDSVQDTPDGGAIVTLDEEEPEGEKDFYANLVEDLGEGQQSEISTTLLKFIEMDKEARKKRDEQYEEGLRRTGLGDDAPGGAQFNGASRVVHPMLTEASVDFAARAIKELFPANGPVKEYIPGEVTQEKIDKAERKTKHMNRQLTVDIKEFRPELEQLLTQLPIAGGQYMKLRWNARKKRPEALFIAIDDIFLPFAATSFYTAERKTHRQYITRAEYEKRVASGMYADVDLPTVSQNPDQSAAAKANDKIEGRASDPYNEDGLREIFEVYCELDLDEEEPVEDESNTEKEENEDPKKAGEGHAPYIVTIDAASEKILSIYRNWREDDETKEELVHIVEWPFVPWRGAYPIGLSHMIGGLSGAATGALRALLDTAHINNIPTMLKLKGPGGGQSPNIQATQVTEIEGALNTDDVRKIAMPLPFNPPSPVLYQLLGFLVDAGKGVVRTTFENLSDGANPNMPVGTTLALIEQGMTVFNAIHARLHNAMQRTLEVLHRINEMYLDEHVELKEEGELVVHRADYEGPMDVIPVSDPNIFSETQRFAQIQAVAQRAQMMPQLYDLRKVEELILKRLKIPEGEKLLLEKPEPKRMNAINENVALTMGRPVVAFPDQDHLAHLQTHLDFAQSPLFGMSPLVGRTFAPGVLQHLKEHLVMWYASEAFHMLSGALGGDASEFMDKDPEVSAELDRTLAAASPKIIQNAQQTLEKVPPIIQQVMQFAQAMQPPMPQDPTMAAAAASQAETQRKTAADQAKQRNDQQRNELEAAKLQQEQQQDQQDREADLQREQMREQSETGRTQFTEMSRAAMNDADNQTAKDIAVFEAAVGERTALRTGTGINPQPR